MKLVFEALRAGNRTWSLLFWAVSVFLFHAPLGKLINLAIRDERYSQILIVPLISIGLVYLERKRIFLRSESRSVRGPLLALLGITLSYALLNTSPVPYIDNLSFVVFAIVLMWAAGFALCYGLQPFYAASFPILFLLLMIPIPSAALDKIVFALQTWSAQAAYVLFKLAGLPVLRQGFTFSLPGVDIQIAEECSGLRSSVALLITSILAGHLFLRYGFSRVCLSLYAMPVAIFKNAVRIVTISWLGVYVDHGFLHGALHRYGGLPFSLLALIMVAPVLIALQRIEGRQDRYRVQQHPIVVPGPKTLTLSTHQ